MQRLFYLVAASLAAVPAFAGDGPTVVTSSLQSVMVYRMGAVMVHTAHARLAEGSNELIIDDVSTTLDPNSIQVSCTGDVTVMSAGFSKDYLQPETVTPLVRRLRDSIDRLTGEEGRLDVLTKSDEQLLDLLNSNKNIGGAQQGVSAAELAKMMDYYRQQQVLIRTELAGYEDKTMRLKEIGQNLQNQIAEEEAKNTKTSGRILLQLLCPAAGAYDFTVSYLTMAAHWEPAYDLKVGGAGDSLQLLYKARLVQSSGIDWKHVKLSLSTSLPSQSGNAPVLMEKFLRFATVVMAEYQRKFYNGNSVENSVSGKVAGYDLLKRVPGVEVTRNVPADSVDMDGNVGNYLSVDDNQLDVVFNIDIPYDVPSNGKEQGVELKEYKLPCMYEDYAAPVADREAYLLGKMQGWEKLNLLPGEASVMVNGTYIGKSFIDPGSTQDTLNLTLGRDKRIAVKREKVADFSSVKFLGSAKKEVFTYQITVRNNKKQKAQLLLKDQYPISTDNDIEAELLESSGAEVNKNTGILTWKTELAPGESKVYRISYSIKYPRDKTVNIN